MPTMRNARGIDIVAYNQDCSVKITLQVKSLSKNDPVPIGSSLSKIMGDYWIIVTNLNQEQPDIYILTPDEVKEFSRKSVQNGRTFYWLRKIGYMKEEYKEKWERIENSVHIPLPRR